jgi:hypothetical protein
MAITFVQGTVNNTAGSSFALSLTGVTTGNLLLVTMGFEPASVSVTGISDGVNTYTKIVEIDDGGNARSEIWYAQNVIGGNLTATVSCSGTATSPSAKLLEFSGASTTSPIRSSNSAFGDGITIDCPNLTTGATTDMLVETLYTDENCESASSPWTGMTSESCYPSAYYSPGSVGTFNLTVTPGGPDSWASTGIVIQVSGTPPPTNTSNMFLVF